MEEKIVWMLHEVSGPETIIEGFFRSKDGAKVRKRELIDEHPFPKDRQRYGDSLIITPHPVWP